MDRVCSRRLTVAAPLVCMILSPRQVKTVQMSCDNKNSVLALAAINKSPDVFGAVMSGIENTMPHPKKYGTTTIRIRFVTCSRVGCTLDQLSMPKLT